MGGQKCQVLQKLNSSLINHSTQAKAKIIVLVPTITRKDGHIPAIVTTLVSVDYLTAASLGTYVGQRRETAGLMGSTLYDRSPKNHEKELLVFRQKQNKPRNRIEPFNKEKYLTYT